MSVRARRAPWAQPTSHFIDEVLFEAWFQEDFGIQWQSLSIFHQRPHLPAEVYLNTKVHVLFELAGKGVKEEKEVMSLRTPGESRGTGQQSETESGALEEKGDRSSEHLLLGGSQGHQWPLQQSHLSDTAHSGDSGAGPCQVV
jgi:hypothetical protein